MKNRCIAMTTGVAVTPTSAPKSGITRWPPDSKLYEAAQYVIQNFDSLTLYLKDPRLRYTNNAQERAVRSEKSMLDTSKFRKTRNGRATLDILRSINATCVAAQVEISDYLIFLYKNRNELESDPGKFTPFAFSKEKGPPDRPKSL